MRPLAVSIRVAVDCMGGDHGIPVTVPSALAFLAHTPDASLLLVGDLAKIETAARELNVGEVVVLDVEGRPVEKR